MSLYHIQDSDRPMLVKGNDYKHALDKWKERIAKENDESISDVSEPLGIHLICSDDEFIGD
jgi:hypothetical protein